MKTSKASTMWNAEQQEAWECGFIAMPTTKSSKNLSKVATRPVRIRTDSDRVRTESDEESKLEAELYAQYPVGCIPNELVNKPKKKKKGKESTVVVKSAAPPTPASRWTNAAATTPQIKKRPSLHFKSLLTPSRSPASDASSSPSPSTPTTPSVYGSSRWNASTPSLASSPFTDRFASGDESMEKLSDSATEQVRVREPGRLRRMTSSLFRLRVGDESKAGTSGVSDTVFDMQPPSPSAMVPPVPPLPAVLPLPVAARSPPTQAPPALPLPPMPTVTAPQKAATAPAAAPKKRLLGRSRSQASLRSTPPGPPPTAALPPLPLLVPDSKPLPHILPKVGAATDLHAASQKAPSLKNDTQKAKGSKRVKPPREDDTVADTRQKGLLFRTNKPSTDSSAVSDAAQTPRIQLHPAPEEAPSEPKDFLPLEAAPPVTVTDATPIAAQFATTLKKEPALEEDVTLHKEASSEANISPSSSGSSSGTMMTASSSVRRLSSMVVPEDVATDQTFSVPLEATPAPSEDTRTPAEPVPEPEPEHVPTEAPAVPKMASVDVEPVVSASSNDLVDESDISTSTDVDTSLPEEQEQQAAAEESFEMPPTPIWAAHQTMSRPSSPLPTSGSSPVATEDRPSSPQPFSERPPSQAAPALAERSSSASPVKPPPTMSSGSISSLASASTMTQMSGMGHGTPAKPSPAKSSRSGGLTVATPSRRNRPRSYSTPLKPVPAVYLRGSRSPSVKDLVRFFVKEGKGHGTITTPEWDPSLVA